MIFYFYFEIRWQYKNMCVCTVYWIMNECAFYDSCIILLIAWKNFYNNVFNIIVEYIVDYMKLREYYKLLEIKKIYNLVKPENLIIKSHSTNIIYQWIRFHKWFFSKKIFSLNLWNLPWLRNYRSYNVYIRIFRCQMNLLKPNEFASFLYSNTLKSGGF